MSPEDFAIHSLRHTMLTGLGKGFDAFRESCDWQDTAAYPGVRVVIQKAVERNFPETAAVRFGWRESAAAVPTRSSLRYRWLTFERKLLRARSSAG
jgi:hypothetical protein